MEIHLLAKDTLYLWPLGGILLGQALMSFDYLLELKLIWFLNIVGIYQIPPYPPLHKVKDFRDLEQSTKDLV